MATLPYHVDCLDLHSGSIVVGLSSLEGNVWDGAIGMLNIEDGVVLAYMGQPSGVASITFLGSNNSLVGAGCDDGMIRYCATEGLFSRQIIQAHHDIVSDLMHISSLNRLLSCSWDQGIKLWDISNPKFAIYTVQNAHYGSVHGIASSVSEPYVVASVGADAMLKMWDTRMNQKEGCISLYDHESPLACIAWDESNPHRLFTGSDTGELYLFDTRKLKDCSKLTIHNSRIRAVKTSTSFPDIVSTCSDDMSISVVDATLGQVLHK
jgi:methylosome protein 50